MAGDSNPQLESPESSSPIVTRSVAAGLVGTYAEAYTFSPFQKLALQVLGHFPQAAARYVVSRFETLSGLDPTRLAGLDINRLAHQRLNDYAQLTRAGTKFPCLTLGAALGGASAHLALALGGPFLPQAFVTTLRGGAPDGDAGVYFRQSAELAREISLANPDVMTIQHYDPVHDEWMTRYVNHLRFKLLRLPRAYVDFIREHLEPGGEVCYLDCGAQWLRYRVGDRNVFQVGGWGDLSPEEFLEGSPRLSAYCERVGLRRCDWRLPGFFLERGPESEWGCEPGLGEDLQAFCSEEGYRFVRISLPEPHDFSRLAFRAVETILRIEGRTPAGVLVEMFSQFDASAVQNSGLLPVWLVFNTWDSLKFLQSMRPAFPAGKPVFFSPLSTFTLTPDLVSWEDWAAALKGTHWTNVGARASHYPADTQALIRWAQPLRSWARENWQPIQTRLKAKQLAELGAGQQSREL